jgi:hypothetical protein
MDLNGAPIFKQALFYNGISSLGEKFKPLIEGYGMLEHLDEELLLRKSYVKDERFNKLKAYK